LASANISMLDSPLSPAFGLEPGQSQVKTTGARVVIDNPRNHAPHQTHKDQTEEPGEKEWHTAMHSHDMASSVLVHVDKLVFSSLQELCRTDLVWNTRTSVKPDSVSIDNRRFGSGCNIVHNGPVNLATDNALRAVEQPAHIHLSSRHSIFNTVALRSAIKRFEVPLTFSHTVRRKMAFGLRIQSNWRLGLVQ
jgi:hypothetical protein